MPVLEAMAQHIPVVTSRGTSTEEVAGDAAVLVDPTDVASIANGITTALANADALAVAGGQRAAEFSWERSTELTIDAYRDAVQAGRAR